MRGELVTTMNTANAVALERPRFVYLLERAPNRCLLPAHRILRIVYVMTSILEAP